MKNTTQSVSNTEWGEARREFYNRLPEILEKHSKGFSLKSIHKELNLRFSYRQFCRNFKDHNQPGQFHPNSLVTIPSHPHPPHQSEQPTKVVQAGAASGVFSLPTLDIGENE